MAVVVPPPRGLGRDSHARATARAALVDVLWRADGARKLPTERALVAAIEACDPRDVWWVCEASSAGPLYLLPTREWVRALARFLDAQRVRSVLEVAAGDGFLSSCIARACPRLRVIATDSHAWSRPAGRMNAADARALRGVPLSGIPRHAHVEKIAAAAAVKRYRPDLVIVSWPPPGRLVEQVIRAPSRLVLDISVDGDVCGDLRRTWRFEKEFLDGPLEARGLCRLDTQPKVERHTRATLYYGKRHRLYAFARAAPQA